jgi:cell division protein DivIC
MKNKAKKSPRWVWLIVLLFVAINIPGIKNILVVNEQMNTLRHEESRLLQEQKALNNEIKRLNTPAEMERLAREELGMIRPGEKLMVPVVSP